MAAAKGVPRDLGPLAPASWCVLFVCFLPCSSGGTLSDSPLTYQMVGLQVCAATLGLSGARNGT